MKMIAKHALGKELLKDATILAAQARDAKIKDNSVINATLGTFYYDDGNFVAFPTVKKYMQSTSDNDFYTYATVDGGPAFKDAVLNWVFRKEKDNVLSKMHHDVVSSIGGMGGLYSSVRNALDVGETLLISDLCWGPYYDLASSCCLNVMKYNLYDGNKFNIKGFINCCEEIIKKEGKVVTILNDPSNNPTGYSLTLEELEQVISYMNSKENVPFSFIYDIAYIDYMPYDPDEVRKRFPLLAKANENILVTVIFSAAKTFSSYGLRLGAQILLSKDKEVVDEMSKILRFTARSHWSNAPKPGISAVVAICQSEEAQRSLRKEIDETVYIIKRRADLFMKEAKEVGLVVYPYIGGFFISIPCQNVNLILDKIRDEEKIHLIPIESGVRFAVCAVPYHEIPSIASRIKRVIDKYDQ